MFKHAQIKAVGGNAVTYHEQEFERGDARFSVSSSMLREFYRCPDRWRKGYNSPDSNAKSFGNLLDCLLLTPELFAARYVVRPEIYESTVMRCPTCGSESDAKECRKCKTVREPVTVTKGWNSNAAECKAWIERNAGKQIVSSGDYNDARAAAESFQRDEPLAMFLNESKKQVWVEGAWEDDATGLVVPVRALLDMVPDKDGVFGKSLGDLKTTMSAALEPFQRHVYKMGYHMQAAFHADLYCAATGEDRPNWCWLLVENYPPYQTGRRICAESFLEIGRAAYRKALSVYCACLKSGQWPDYDHTDITDAQGWTIVQPDAWMESKGLFDPQFEIRTDAEPEAEADADIIP